MPVICDLTLRLGVEDILAGQGLEPARPVPNRLVFESARRALAIGSSLLAPTITLRMLDVGTVGEDGISLAGGCRLTGPIARNPGRAIEKVVALVCTIGPGVERKASESMGENPALALALDGFGTAAVAALAGLARLECCRLASSSGMSAGTAYVPGMPGWPLWEGQQQIFDILGNEPPPVSLGLESQMVPLKSLSLVVGIGHGLATNVCACSECQAKRRCGFRALSTRFGVTEADTVGNGIWQGRTDAT
jgi:hypothetical protein